MNVASPEGTRLLAAMLAALLAALLAAMLAALLAATLAATALLVSHTGLSCYMFSQTVVFSNFQRDTEAATPTVLHSRSSRL